MNREVYRYILAGLLAAIAVIFVDMTRPEPEPAPHVDAVEPASRSIILEEEPEPEQECGLAVTTFYDIPLDVELQAHITNECGAYEIDPIIVFAMIEKESGFHADEIGDGGESYGMMQVKEKYHRDRMERLGVTDLLNPYENVMVGVDYLAELHDKYDGNMEMALMAYNAGPRGANKHWFSKGIFSNRYSQEVVEMSKSIKEVDVDELLQ